MPSITSSQPLQPAYYFGHAGASLLFRQDPVGLAVKENLLPLGRELLALQPRPRALVVFSGHFEASEIHGPEVVEVNVKRNTPILHDFVNDFHDSHPELYAEDWDHIDAPDLGLEIWSHLKASGIKAKRVERGIDHGVWVPFKVMFPPERPLDIPIVLVSTFHGYDLASQLRLGEALRSLRARGFVIIGSGMAVHSFASLGEIQAAQTDAERALATSKVLAESKQLHRAVVKAVTIQDGKARGQALLDLERLPEFKRSHPTVEHFTPLLVAAGAAGNANVEYVGEEIVEPAFSYANFRFSDL